MTYDAIIVGGRCAGAPTAMLLARRGYRVLLVDADRFPSDMPMSTHLVWQSGVRNLRDWGLLDAVADSNCPAIRHCEVDLGPIILKGEPTAAGGVRDAYSPRRHVLDWILLEAAAEAGVEVRDGVQVTGVLDDDGAVGGIVGEANGASIRETAHIVIGADGRNSRIARHVAAETYDRVPPLQGTYFSYWSDLPLPGLALHVREGRGVYAWPTNDDLALVGVNWAARDFPQASADVEASYLDVVGACAPELRARMGAAKREARFHGGSIGSFMRKPYGPGWALVGDAGLTMDPCTGAGINNAFRDADFLVEALHAGLSGRQPMADALAEYHARRDAAAKPIYDFTCQLAPFAAPAPEMLQIFGALVANQGETDRFLGLFAQTVSPADFFCPESLGRLLQETAAR